MFNPSDCNLFLLIFQFVLKLSFNTFSKCNFDVQWYVPIMQFSERLFELFDGGRLLSAQDKVRQRKSCFIHANRQLWQINTFNTKISHWCRYGSGSLPAYSSACSETAQYCRWLQVWQTEPTRKMHQNRWLLGYWVGASTNCQYWFFTMRQICLNM